MTMYLPNSDLHPTGFEPGEFLEVPPMRERPKPGSAGLDPQTRLNITRWATEYITGLVENHDGGPEDVRSVIHQLHDQLALTDDGSP